MALLRFAPVRFALLRSASLRSVWQPVDEHQPMPCAGSDRLLTWPIGQPCVLARLPARPHLRDQLSQHCSGQPRHAAIGKSSGTGQASRHTPTLLRPSPQHEQGVLLTVHEVVRAACEINGGPAERAVTNCTSRLRLMASCYAMWRPGHAPGIGDGSNHSRRTPLGPGDTFDGPMAPGRAVSHWVRVVTTSRRAVG